MNKKIIVTCQMFDYSHQVYLLEDNEIKRTLVTTTDKLNEVVLKTLKEEDCHVVELKGSKLYAKGVAKKIQKYQLEKYSDYELIINII